MEFVYNSAVHESTRRAPFEVLHTYHPQGGMEPERKEVPWEANIETTCSNIEKAKDIIVQNPSGKPVKYIVNDMSTSNC